MINYYDLLKPAQKDYYSELLARRLRGSGGIEEIEGVPPLTFQSDGTPLLDYLISGNMSQTSTPSPTTPIQPQETGERTGNLFSCNIEQGTITAEGTLRSAYNRVRSDDFIIMETGEYTINALSESDALRILIFEYMEDGTFVSRTPTDWANVPYTFSLTGKRKMKFVFSYSDGNITPTMVNSVMLNTGSTALPYESFGVKIPISSADTTTPVYLGEVETTRYVRKLVLDGTENWKKQTHNDSIHTFELSLGFRIINGLCSHYAKYYGPNIDKIDGIYLSNTLAIIITDLRFTTPADFKSFLAQQYTNGTPVTVWYVLATPKTGIVNEPLRKIGDYADTLSMEQAGVSIPTNNGSTTVDVETTLKPSEMYIKYQE